MTPPQAARRYSLTASDEQRDVASLADAVREGLTAPGKHLPCRFLYDEEGSRLFEEICDLPEYYLTRAEREILETRSGEVADAFDVPITLAELGSGSSEKTRLLIESLLRRHGSLRYVPVDISRSMLESSSQALLQRYRGLEIHAIAAEYQHGIRQLRSQRDRPKLIAWLGSNVGNFGRDEAARLLRGVRASMADPDRILIGVDLRKDAAALECAYDDDAGVTARFNLNLLARINRELGADFDLSAFEHRARFEEAEGRVRIDLVSLRRQRVSIAELDLEVDFHPGESIHTEDSYKYSFEEIDALARDAGLEVTGRWLDAAGLFSLSLLSTA